MLAGALPEMFQRDSAEQNEHCASEEQLDTASINYTHKSALAVSSRKCEYGVGEDFACSVLKATGASSYPQHEIRPDKKNSITPPYMSSSCVCEAFSIGVGIAGVA